jgi:hypothetical protein
MKKVVRITESDLTNLVKRIINEAPFDRGSIEPIDPTKMSDEEVNKFFGEYEKIKGDYNEFEKSDLRKLLADTEVLLAIAKDYCKNYLYDDRPHQYCSEIPYIEKRVDKYHSEKYSKRISFPEQPILPQLVARRRAR